MFDFGIFTGFDWDDGNYKKNWVRHAVSAAECEEVFFNRPIVATPDADHSGLETRFCLLGRSDRGRELFVVFTQRGTLIRVISARDMTRREREVYAELCRR